MQILQTILLVGLSCWVAVLLYRLRTQCREDVAQSRLTETSELTDKLYASLFDRAPIGYLEIDRQGTVQRVNRKECELRGLGRREILRKHIKDLAPAAERERCALQVQSKISGQIALVPYLTEYWRKDGSVVTVEVHEELLSNSDGYVEGMRIAAIDATGRKTSEDEAYRTATELRAMFQAFPDLFLRLDGNAEVLDYHGGQNSDSFVSAANLKGRKLKDMLPLEVVLQFQEAQENVRKSGALQIVEFLIQGPLGQDIYEARMLAVGWDEWLAVIRNITERKHDERQLKQYAQELKTKNKELEAALATAREATELKSRFLANMSHEIRTPMNGVMGMTDFLLGTELTAEQHEYASTIRRSADALLTLINDILDLSKIEAGKLRVDRVAFSLEQLLEETSAIFALQAHAKGLEFQRATASGLPRQVYGDPGRIRQILTNLLGNAIKFTERGQITSELELVREEPGTIQVRFLVCDTGIRIPEEQSHRLFRSFTQVDGSSTRKYGGTGLGLAISKQLVELLGGAMGVESEVDKGSRFWFTVTFEKLTPAEALKFEKEAGKASAQPANAGASSHSPEVKESSVGVLKPEIDSAPHQILLAEDNEINQRITRRLLEKLGLTVKTVSNGLEAADSAAKQRYALILMDCQMPRMDGFEATASIRSAERDRHHTPICALTANAMEGDRERCLDSGMDDYISKPVHLEDLRAVVARWIPQVVCLTGATVTESKPAGLADPQFCSKIERLEIN